MESFRSRQDTYGPHEPDFSDLTRTLVETIPGLRDYVSPRVVGEIGVRGATLGDLDGGYVDAPNGSGYRSTDLDDQ